MSATTSEMRYSERRAGESLSVKALKTWRTRRNWRRHQGSFASRSSSRPREKKRYASRVSCVSSRCRSSAVTSRATSRVQLSNHFDPGGFAPPDPPTRVLAGTPSIPAPHAWLARYRSLASYCVSNQTDLPADHFERVEREL